MSFSTCVPGGFLAQPSTALPRVGRRVGRRATSSSRRGIAGSARILCPVSSPEVRERTGRHRPELSRSYQLQFPNPATTYTASAPRFRSATVECISANASSPHISRGTATFGLRSPSSAVCRAPSSLRRAAASRRQFSTSNMVAAKLDGTAVAKRIRDRLREEIAERQKINPRFQPCLKIIQGASCTARHHTCCVLNILE